YPPDRVSPSGQLEPPSPADFPTAGSHVSKLKPPAEAVLPFVELPRPLQESGNVLTRYAGISAVAAFSTPGDRCRGRSRQRYRTRKFSATVARYERHNFFSMPHPCRPQGFSVAPADDRRYDGAQPRTQHDAVLSKAGQLPGPLLWQVTRAVRSGTDSGVPALPGPGQKGLREQPVSGGHCITVPLRGHSAARSVYRNASAPPQGAPSPCDPQPGRSPAVSGSGSVLFSPR